MRVRLKQQRLLQLLAESGISQNHWALKLGLSRGHWSEIVNGKHPYPSPKTRERMVEAFGLPLDALFEIESGVAPWAGSDFRRAIADRYLIDSELGQGGMGAVYLARDVRHGRPVAVKVISSEAVSGIGVTPFLREIATVAHLQHPNILPLFDSGEAGGHPFYVMPYIRGGSLRALLVRESRLPVRNVARLVEGIASALAYGHGQRVLHCDVKPENVLLDGAHPYVMDFGIARKLHSEVLPWRSGRELDFSAGTPAYVSPEQASGDKTLDARSDVYSLGCVVYEMLAGRTPFEGTTTEAIVSRRFIESPPPLKDYAPEVGPTVEAAVARAMEREPSRRFAGSMEFAVALTAATQQVSTRLSRLSVHVTRTIGPLSRRLGGRGVPSFRSSAVGSLGQDIVYAWRGVRRAPGFALVVVLTLGLALGANATMFGLADRLLLRPPPGIGHADRLRRVSVSHWINGLGDPSTVTSYPAFEDLRDNTQSFAGVVATDNATYSYGRGQAARPVEVTLATGQYFAVLEVPAFRGRYFGAPDDQPGAPPVAVLSYRFWRGVLGGDTTIVGRPLALGNQTFTVIGVTPPDFNGTDLSPVDLWAPLTTRASGSFGGDSWRTERSSFWLETFARLRPGVTDAAAVEDATRAYRLPHLNEKDEFLRRAVVRLGTLEGSGGRATTNRVAAWLLGVTAIVLIIACANVANLMLARGLMRRGEIAVRLALGVSRGRLLRQLLTESLVLAAIGVGVGLVVLRWGSMLIWATLIPPSAWDRGPLTLRVVAVTLGAMLLSAVAAGLLPLWRGTRMDVAAQLHAGTRTTPGHSRRLRSVLLLAQTSLSTALLIGAGLFVRSMQRVHAVDLGFQPQDLAVVSVDLTSYGATGVEQVAFFRDVLERLRRTPGVLAAGAAIGAPFLGSWGESIRVEGLDSIPQLAGGGPYYTRASAGLMEALGVRLIRGRLFTAADDRPDAQPVTVVTERTARLLWPRRDPLGQCLFVGDARRCHMVVGIVADLHRLSLDEASTPFLFFFTPLGLESGSQATYQQLFVRTAGSSEQYREVIRAALRDAHPDLPYVRIAPYQDLIDRRARAWQLGATLLSVFGGMSLVIAAIGLYAVLSYAVSQRTPELGIRAALGATRAGLVHLIAREGFAATGIGLLIGAGLVLGLSRWVGELLFQTSPRDPFVYGVTGVVLLGVALGATIVPGRRATRVDPVIAMKAE